MLTGRKNPPIPLQNVVLLALIRLESHDNNTMQLLIAFLTYRAPCLPNTAVPARNWPLQETRPENRNTFRSARSPTEVIGTTGPFASACTGANYCSIGGEGLGIRSSFTR